MNKVKTVAAVALLAFAGAAQAAESEPPPGVCEKTVETHGFLSRGQFQCGFRYYGRDMMEAARGCASLMSNDEQKRWLASGMEMFDYNEGKRGHAGTCAALLADFPKVLKK